MVAPGHHQHDDEPNHDEEPPLAVPSSSSDTETTTRRRRRDSSFLTNEEVPTTTTTTITTSGTPYLKELDQKRSEEKHPSSSFAASSIMMTSNSSQQEHSAPPLDKQNLVHSSRVGSNINQSNLNNIIHNNTTNSSQQFLSPYSSLASSTPPRKARVSISDDQQQQQRGSSSETATLSSPASSSPSNPSSQSSSSSPSLPHGDAAMMLNEKAHQIFLPVCLFLCYAYLVLYSTDYPICMAILCVLAIVINFKFVRSKAQQLVFMWMVKQRFIELDDVPTHEDGLFNTSTTHPNNLMNTNNTNSHNNNPVTSNHEFDDTKTSHNGDNTDNHEIKIEPKHVLSVEIENLASSPSLPPQEHDTSSLKTNPNNSSTTVEDTLTESNKHIPSQGSVPFYSTDYWKFAPSSRNSSSSSNLSLDMASMARRQRYLEVYTCKVMIVLNIVVFFFRLLLCTKDYTVGWLMIGFLSSTIHNYSYIILQNALVDCRVHSYDAIMWIIAAQHVVSFGNAFILSAIHHRHLEAFGTFCLLTVLNFMLNSVSYKLMNRLNTMKLMTSKLKEANRSKNALVSSISHEFRSPLMSISGSIELLLDTPLTSEQVNYIKTIGSCSSILLTLIEDILQYSKLEKTNMEIATNSMLGKNSHEDEEEKTDPKTVFSLSDCLSHVKSIASSYASSFDVTIDFVSSKFLPAYVLGESVRLQQVLINLLTNSIKASQKNQVVTLAVEVPEDDNPEDLVDDGRANTPEIVVVKPRITSPETTLNTDPNSEVVITKTVVFHVIDHGIGIPKDVQKLLFKPFSSHNRTGDGSVIGTGLGLTILRKIIINMKGGISYKTECAPAPNQGTTFSISIPFKLPDGKKKNSLKQIEEILRTHPVVSNGLSAGEGEGNTLSSSGGVIAPVSNLSKDDEMENGNNIDTELQKTHLLHKELYIMKKRQSKPSVGKGIIMNGQHHSAFNTTTIEQAHASSSTIPNGITVFPDNIYETKILLAEDNPINLSVLRKLLEKGGFKRITTSSNGFELVEAFKNEYHNIIVTDLHMPCMNGIEAANEIRSLPNGDKTKIILLTADALMDKFNNMDSIDSCLNKPISKDDLNEAIISAIKLQRQEQEQ
ncbi:hypothetical protein FDP41_007567 [Naegleria fowleri]|uniref:Histidine kinase n=1 Tax=Naegleria fowleri TaxID=5763 RepID=A0A6A5C9K9_NAEFO|nr:uncharacterized protein FDP41_007567 [Naegleria fowleri]KAF0983652.1 hypothetical protein FDP41_007567 [Naegleria fowleri]